MSPRQPASPQSAMTWYAKVMPVDADASQSRPEEAWGYECALPYLAPEWGASALLG